MWVLLKYEMMRNEDEMKQNEDEMKQKETK